MSRILPTPLVFISGYANTENVFCCLNLNNNIENFIKTILTPPVLQVLPLNQFLQLHLNFPTRFIQVPPFLQGFDEHSLISLNDHGFRVTCIITSIVICSLKSKWTYLSRKRLHWIQACNNIWILQQGLYRFHCSCTDLTSIRWYL